MNRPVIYLDHSATTPVHPEVLETMLPFLRGEYGNPNSLHRSGQRARQAVEGARGSIARRLGATPREIVFTSGGTESDNLALRGIARARRGEGRHLITTAVEHEAVLATMEALARAGFELTILPVDEVGQVTAEAVAAALRPDTILVSVMAANNEVGTLQPIEPIGALLRGHPASFHCDAVQAGAFLPLDVERLGVDALALSAHKLHGPKGAGVLYLRRGTPYESPMTGASQESGRRAGTENVAGIVGLARALEIAQEGRAAKNERLRALRDRLVGGLLEAIPAARLTGHPRERLPGHASFTMGAGIEADTLLLALDAQGIAASSGSACGSARRAASPVLLAMGIPEDEALSALRLTLGDDNEPDEIERVIEQLPGIVQRVAGLLSL